MYIINICIYVCMYVKSNVPVDMRFRYCRFWIMQFVNTYTFRGIILHASLYLEYIESLSYIDWPLLD